MKEPAQFFQGFKLLYVRREANHVAHLYAKEAVSLNFVVFYVSPDFLTEAVLSQIVSPD
jgi:hypothetical protein